VNTRAREPATRHHADATRRLTGEERESATRRARFLFVERHVEPVLLPPKQLVLVDHLEEVFMFAEPWSTATRCHVSAHLAGSV